MPADFDRRSFLGASLLTLAAAPAAASASSSGDPDVDGLLAEESTLLTTRFLPSEAREDRNALLSRSLATLLWTAHLSEPVPAGRSPERLHRLGLARLPAMIDCVFAHGLLLERTSAADLAALDASLKADPPDDKAAFFTSAVDRSAPGLSGFANRRLHGEALWRLQREGAQAYSRELLQRLDRLAARRGIDWRAEVEGFADRPFEAPLDEPSNSLEEVKPLTSRRKARVLALYARHGSNPATVHRHGRNKITLGSVLLSVGVVTEAATAPFVVPWMFGGACVGAALIIAGITLIARGAQLKEISKAAAEAGL